MNRLMIGVMIAAMLLPCTVPASAENQAPVIEDGAGAYPEVLCFGDRLYYVSENGVMCCRPDGSDRRDVSDRRGTLFCDEENLYCGTESEIVRISENGTEEVILTVQPLVNEGAFAIMNTMDCFAAHDGWIYYVLTMATGLGLWRVGTDGSGNSRICRICPPENTILAPIRFGNGNEIYIQYGSKDGESWSLICVSPEQDTENT